MRWRLGKFLPIVLIAILAQILAPIGASWAAGFAASDPLRLAGICASDTKTEQPGQTDQHHVPCACCTLCSVSQTAPPLDDPQSSISTLVRSVKVAAWAEQSPDLRSGHVRSHAQARGPPTIS